MITVARMPSRGWLGALLLIGGYLQAGCDKDRTLICAESIDQACAAPATCVLTWDDAQGATSFCAEATRWTPLRIDCGPYHVVAVSFVDASRTYYYDAASGMLSAIVTADAVSATTTCNAGPAAGFTPPVCRGASRRICRSASTAASTPPPTPAAADISSRSALGRRLGGRRLGGRRLGGRSAVRGVTPRDLRGLRVVLGHER